jgi:hypothetical protein
VGHDVTMDLLHDYDNENTCGIWSDYEFGFAILLYYLVGLAMEVHL